MNLFPKKICPFCKMKIVFIDHKNAKLLQQFLDYFNRIKRREKTGVCLKHQKMLARAVKRARHLALCGFTR